MFPVARAVRKEEAGTCSAGITPHGRRDTCEEDVKALGCRAWMGMAHHDRGCAYPPGHGYAVRRCWDIAVVMFDLSWAMRGCPWEGFSWARVRLLSMPTWLAIYYMLPLLNVLLQLSLPPLPLVPRCLSRRIRAGTVVVWARGLQFPSRRPLSLLRLFPGC